jgi:hypothetical protein
LSFQVSCSYGPGRYDPEYEDKGHNYPYGFVRWTEQRNIEAVLQLMSEGKLDVQHLISHRIPFAEAEKAYNLLTEDSDAPGIVLSYPETTRMQSYTTATTVEPGKTDTKKTSGRTKPTRDRCNWSR